MLTKFLTMCCLFLFVFPALAIEYWMYEVLSAKTQFEPVPQRVYKLAPLDRLYGYGKPDMSNVDYIESQIVAHEEIEQGAWILMAKYPSGRQFVMDVTQSKKGLINNDSVRNMMFDIIQDALQKQVVHHSSALNSTMKINMDLSKHTFPKIELDGSNTDNINLMMADFYLTKLMSPIANYFHSMVTLRFELSYKEGSVNLRLYNRSDRFRPARDMYDTFQPLNPKLSKTLLE